MISNRIKIVTLLLLLSSCGGQKKESDIKLDEENNKSNNEYASYFEIAINNNSDKIITIDEAWGTNIEKSSYLLLKNNKETTKKKSSIYPNSTVIKTPVKKIVCMSTSHLPFIKLLGESASIVAVSGAKYISDPEIKESINEGLIIDIGYEASINYEVLMKLSPNVVFTYGVSGENNQYIEKIKQAGINVVVVSDYVENHPLGKLEYLKFFGAFFNKEELADSLYNTIKNRYLETKSKATRATKRPKVLLNAPWKDAWYIPGEYNYMSKLIKDAGADVLLSKPGESHSYTYSIENIIKEAYSADYWLNPNFYSTLKELKNSNPVFTNLPVLEKGKVYNNNNRDTPGGGSDFWERGVVEPDVILQDLINILHPELVNKKELVYYKLLK